jgi:hypothetical protein
MTQTEVNSQVERIPKGSLGNAEGEEDLRGSEGNEVKEEAVAEREGNNYQAWEDFCLKNGSSQGQNLALAVCFCAGLLDSGYLGAPSTSSPPSQTTIRRSTLQRSPQSGCWQAVEGFGFRASGLGFRVQG